MLTLKHKAPVTNFGVQHQRQTNYWTKLCIMSLMQKASYLSDFKVLFSVHSDHFHTLNLDTVQNYVFSSVAYNSLPQAMSSISHYCLLHLQYRAHWLLRWYGL